MKKETRKTIFDKFGGHCAYCGTEINFDKFQVDHFVAKLKGGSDDVDNLMPSCIECNRYKATLSIETFREWLEKSKKQLLRTQNLRILNRIGG
ncbi:MAG: HNH endonuclease, partial [Bacteroidales bacterium]|nr:HNH endonuclease [Bacteroidales bacterium]